MTERIDLAAIRFECEELARTWPEVRRGLVLQVPIEDVLALVDAVEAAHALWNAQTGSADEATAESRLDAALARFQFEASA